jgi:hypothetical protein
LCEPPRAGNCVHGIGPGVFAFRVWGRGACGGKKHMLSRPALGGEFLGISTS